MRAVYAMRKILLFFFVAVLSLVQKQLVLAQSIWMDPREDRYIWLEILAPNYHGPDRFSFISSTTFLSVRYAVWHSPLKIRTVAELSFTHTEVKSAFFDFDPRTGKFVYASGTDNVFGNPYLGLEIGAPGKYDEKNAFVFGELGFRLPVAPDSQEYAKQFGTLSDIDRSEAFNDKVTTITGRFNYVDRAASGFGLRIRIGPSLFAAGNMDDELFLDQAMMLTFEKGFVWAGVAYTARTLLTGEWVPWSALTDNQIGFAVRLKMGKFQPGLHYRTPLDEDLVYKLQYVYGLNIGFEL